jgi:hypothetical protein
MPRAHNAGHAAEVLNVPLMQRPPVVVALVIHAHHVCPKPKHGNL